MGVIFSIEVNGKEIQAQRGDTILEALHQNGIKVPTLCSMKNLSPSGACRICVVEVEGKSGLVPSCSHPVEEWMKIKTHSPKVIKARKTIVELLLSNHPDDCLYCERNGSCELQDLSAEMNIRERRITCKKLKHKIDQSSPSIVRDPSKCILCGRCVRMCDEVMQVSALELVGRGSKSMVTTALGKEINFSSCIFCGQCLMVCPTGALYEKSNLDEVQNALNNPNVTVVVQLAPSISVSVSEELGFKSGKDINGVLVSALRKIGFSHVFETGFGADVVAMEVAHELNIRMQQGEKLPLLTGCCPAWIKYMEQFHPELLSLVSTIKSPQQALGAIIKECWAKEVGIPSQQLFSVAIMPCTAKKFEAQREEMTHKGISDVDAVLTTRELVQLLHLYGIDVQSLEPQISDTPFSIRSSAGKLFATSGGLSEAVTRTLHFTLTGKEIRNIKIAQFRNVVGYKKFDIEVGKQTIKVGIANGMKGAVTMLREIAAGQCDMHMIEVMACEGGCLHGGGQPFVSDDKDKKTRAKAIYEIDESEAIWAPYKNPAVAEIYAKCLGEPGKESSSSILCTRFSERNVLL
ncbi:[FeFe] hydrogenase, group A [Williamwhitmania taraxaci]|uniref:NADH-quinone oxidoreductase subunit G n=1 Tax=Williamwhitmania taraxaci TaxID=1640674 RepID=A0A1G6NRY4_9BACT|nr:[FeFe] hydrogenase, group A [Williamwhitmania taraxaci]SDC70663.1 NADH-quinone oxidoreductase subunit G [Williamwhitmania taraxaci]